MGWQPESMAHNPQPVFVIPVLLEHCHIPSFIFCILLHYNGKAATENVWLTKTKIFNILSFKKKVANL